MELPYYLTMPGRITSNVVFSSPHSGSEYPADFMAKAVLDPTALRSSEDAFVNKLFAEAPRVGAPMLAARYPRAFVDLNRHRDELDPALVQGVARDHINPRVAAGLGVIPRVVSEGRAIQSGKISRLDAAARLAAAYEPFHEMLEQILAQQKKTFGSAILFDCHSMPHDALVSAPLVQGRRPDVILGDRFGASCSHWLIEAALQVFSQEGFVVARNAPFAGGFITQNYGKPSKGIQALQIEIDRSLYMDERAVAPNAGFDDVAARLSRVVRALVRISDASPALAAE